MLQKNMDYDKILRAVYHHQVKWLNCFIKVECFKYRCEPKAFWFNPAVRLKIKEIIEKAKDPLGPECFSYLVLTENNQIYCLSRRPLKDKKGCWWWISFRVLNDEELLEFEKMRRMLLVELELQIISEKHGHLCPDLAIGFRVGKLARHLLPDGNGIIEVGCISCALDAISYMGKWQVKVNPIIGRHIYNFKKDDKLILSIEVKEHFLNQKELCNLEDKLFQHKATIEEAAQYQVEIDRQVENILRIKDHELFKGIPSPKQKEIKMIHSTGFCLRCGTPLKDKTKSDFFCAKCKELLS